jgi:hypothetical protein
LYVRRDNQSSSYFLDRRQRRNESAVEIDLGVDAVDVPCLWLRAGIGRWEVEVAVVVVLH